MLGKLYALVNGQCCEDNPDALTSHEVGVSMPEHCQPSAQRRTPAGLTEYRVVALRHTGLLTA